MADVTVTMVFSIPLETWKAGNPFKVETPWGKPEAVALGDILDRANELEEKLDSLPPSHAQGASGHPSNCACDRCQGRPVRRDAHLQLPIGPVAWRVKNDFGHWHVTNDQALADTWRDVEKYDVQPLSPSDALTPAASEAAGHEDRRTFTIPPGHEAVRDADGRATGETRPIGQPNPSTIRQPEVKP